LESNICKPIFVIGTGRSGSTLFHDLLAYHPQLAWFSSWVNRWPHRSYLAAAARLVDLPLVGPRLRRWAPHPTEAYNIWDACYQGFSRPFRTLRADDVTPVAKQSIRQQVLLHLRYQRKPRFITKYTGWSRIGFLNEIFPDAIFIHVLRDGRAVANSLLQVHFWHGWWGPYNWRWGLLLPEDQEVWERYDRSFVVLAGLQWKIVVQETRSSSELLPSSRFLELKYEEVVQRPIEVMQEVVRFCDLEWTPAFERSVRSMPIRDSIDKWRKDLTPSQQQQLCESLGNYLQELGYVVP